jgi:3-hydroxybutyryl-CoA dehydrogenase
MAHTISTAAVLGAGTMGHGIAHVCAAAGIDTRLYDVDAAGVERGLASVRANLAKGVERGKVSEAERDAALARLRGATDLEDAVRGCDIVIEAVPERIELKRELFAAVAGVVGEAAILASNTSSLSIAAIAAGLPAPGRVIGTHFFNPVHVMKLLEVVVPDGVDPAVREGVLALGARLGKDCIVVRDSPGFATSRLGLVIGLEAIRMVEQGVASAEDIDKAMTLGYGFPMGPLRLTDLVGLDVRLHIARHLARELPEGRHFEPPALLVQMVEAGKLGKKSGEGFYRWP